MDTNPTPSAIPVPEPTTIILFGTGLIMGFALLNSRRKLSQSTRLKFS